MTLFEHNDGSASSSVYAGFLTIADGVYIHEEAFEFNIPHRFTYVVNTGRPFYWDYCTWAFSGVSSNIIYYKPIPIVGGEYFKDAYKSLLKTPKLCIDGFYDLL